MRYSNTLIRYVLTLTAMTSVTWAQAGASETWATLTIQNNLKNPQVRYFNTQPMDEDILLYTAANPLPTYTNTAGATLSWPSTGYLKLSDIQKINLPYGGTGKKNRVYAIIWKDDSTRPNPPHHKYFTEAAGIVAAGTDIEEGAAYALFEYTFNDSGFPNCDLSNIDSFSFPTKMVFDCLPCIDFNCFPATAGFADGVTEQSVLNDLSTHYVTTNGPVLPPECYTEYLSLPSANTTNAKHQSTKVLVDTNGLVPAKPPGPPLPPPYRITGPSGAAPVQPFSGAQGGANKNTLTAFKSWQQTLATLYTAQDNTAGFFVDYSGNNGYSFRLMVYRILAATIPSTPRCNCPGIDGYLYGLALTDFKSYVNTWQCPFLINDDDTPGGGVSSGTKYDGTIYVLPDGFPVEASKWKANATLPNGSCSFVWPIVSGGDQHVSVGSGEKYIGDWTSVLIEQQGASYNGGEVVVCSAALPWFTQGGAQAFVIPDPNGIQWSNLHPQFSVNLASSDHVGKPLITASPTGLNPGWDQAQGTVNGIGSMLGSAATLLLYGMLHDGWNEKIFADKKGFAALAENGYFGQVQNSNVVCTEVSRDGSVAPQISSYMNSEMAGAYNTYINKYVPANIPFNLIDNGFVMTGPMTFGVYANPYTDRFNKCSPDLNVPIPPYRLPGTNIPWHLGLLPAAPPPPPAFTDSPCSSCPLADLSGDGISDGADIAVLLGCWGADCPQHDLNQDGVIDGIDLAYLLTNLGQTQVITIPSWADPSSVQCCPDSITVPNSAARASIAATGYAWKVTDVHTQMEFVMLPTATAGFLMGCSKPTNPYTCQGNDCTSTACPASPYSSAFCGCYPEEVWSDSPQNTVVLTKHVYMGVTEVTRAQWQMFNSTDPSYYTTVGPNHMVCTSLPVQDVSYHSINEWLNTANTTRPDGKFKLPTEAQWEFACRAGSNGAFPIYNGEAPGTQPNDSILNDQGKLKDFAWFNKTTDLFYGSGPKPVGLLKANWYGLYDMNGNVWEWVADWYSEYGTQGTGGTNPTGPSGGTYRVLRGGNWGDMNWDFLKVSYRAQQLPTTRNEGPGLEGIFGFRVAIEVP